MTAFPRPRLDSILLGVLVLVLSPVATAAHQAAPTKFGTILRTPVDLAITLLRKGQSGPGYGDGSCRQTAMVLCAMGRCHRLYGLHDGPIVRSAVHHLFSFRQKDGAFTDAADSHPAARIETTTWVLDALEAMDPFELDAELTAGRKMARQSERCASVE